MDAVPEPDLHDPLVRLAADLLHGTGAAAGAGDAPGSCSRVWPSGTSAGRSWRRWPCSSSRFIGLGISFYPFIVPHSITIWDAAAPDSSLAFLLVGAAVLIPAILAYTAYSYWVFRGKIDAAGGYH